MLRKFRNSTKLNLLVRRMQTQPLLKRAFFRLRYKKKPHCDICDVINSGEEGCDRFKTEQDIKDWEHGFYPESCKYY